MQCWRKALDLNAMMEISFGGGSGRGPNMISVPEHSTWRALAVSLQVESSSNNPHHPWAEGVGMGRKMESDLQVAPCATSSQLLSDHFSFPSNLWGRTQRRHRINSALSQFGGSKGNGSLVENNRSCCNSFCLRRLHTHQRLLLKEFL